MRILIFSWYFPPVNSIGAVRVGKLARYLLNQGHDLAIISAKDWGLPETLPLDFPVTRIAYANSFDVNAPPKFARRMLERASSGKQSRPGQSTRTQSGTGSIAAKGRSWLHRIAQSYVLLTNIPDNRIGWLPWALREAKWLCSEWRPDMVFASGPPFTALLGGRIVASHFCAPWVAELRDRWADDPYEELPGWRAKLDQFVERQVLQNASGLITVTDPWAEFYRRKYGKPVETVYNGYDPADFPFDPGRLPEVTSPFVRINYTGLIYPGRRDPTPLFQALQLLGPMGTRFRVNFYGTDPAQVLPLAERNGVKQLVAALPAVPYHEALAIQWNSDVLLLLQWNDPREQGNCPGKFFEYMASLRPILGIGLETGVPATIIRQRAAGAFSNDPRVIADHLVKWENEKQTYGAVRRLPVVAREGLTRDLQFAKLERFLVQIHRIASSPEPGRHRTNRINES